MRVLLLTQWFDPEPTFKGLVFARELVRQGFDVEVLTGFPNYPGGKVYPGYRIRAVQRELIDGVHITRVALYPNHNQSALRRVANYVSFSASALFYGLFIARRPQVIYAYHPPLTVGIVAALIRLFRRVPVVYDIQDMWPDTLRATGMIANPRLLNVVSAVCCWVYKRVDRIVVLSPGFKRLLIERGVPEQRIDVIYNWADENALASPQGELNTTFPPNSRFRILFAGNMGKAQALDTVLDAAAILLVANPRICFVMLGGGVEANRLSATATARGLSNVVFLPSVPMQVVGRYLRAADALLVHLRKDPLFAITIPSKTQAYMAAGKPLLMAVNGDAANLVTEATCGVIAESENPQALAEAVQKLASMSGQQLEAMGQRAEAWYGERLSVTAGVTRFAGVFKTLGGRGVE